jgi:hypothetical protein
MDDSIKKLIDALRAPITVSEVVTLLRDNSSNTHEDPLWFAADVLADGNQTRIIQRADERYANALEIAVKALEFYADYHKNTDDDGWYVNDSNVPDYGDQAKHTLDTIAKGTS